MRKAFLLFFLLFSALSVGANPILEKAHQTTHQIAVVSLLGSGGECSATAIGPHALLTASHCNAVATHVMVDGKSTELLSIISDGLDHSIYLLGEGIQFANYATVKLNIAPTYGDDIFLFGNPGSFSDMLRKGYVSGFDKEEDDEDAPSLQDIFNILTGKKPKQDEPKAKRHIVTYYDFNGYFGDSGSGIFDKEGNVVAVTSFIVSQSHLGYGEKFMGSFELRLTREQLDQARSFAPVAKHKKE
jgi:hypothetical protein